MASVNSGAKEKAIKSMIDDVFKEFKTSGDFDRFRKEYFVEITSLNSFQNLSKNIDEYIQKLLEEQLRIHHHPSALRKNDLRELVRRRLQENYSFNQQINMYINQIIESKIEGNLKPIISADVDKLTKTNETSGGVSSNDSANASSQNADNTQDSHQNAASVDSKSAASLVQQRKVSIEDFLCIGEANKSNSSQPVTTVSTPPGSNLQQLKSTTTKLAESKPKSSADLVLERQKSLPSKAEINESSIKKEKTTIEEKKPSQNVVKSESKPSKATESQKPAQNLKKPPTTTTTTTTSASSYEFMRKLSFINEAKLQADPKKHYNFDWKLDQIPDDESFLETISVSSDDTSGHSDEEENNSNDSKTE